MNTRTKWALGLAVLAVLAISAALGHPLVSPETLILGAAAVPLAIGDIQPVDGNEVKRLLEAQGRAWEEYKTANDARIKAVEAKGYAPADTVERVATIDADLTKLSRQMADAVLLMQRPKGTDKGLTPEQQEHKVAFNQFLRKGIEIPREVERKAMNSTSDPDGGVLVPKEMEAEIDRVVGVMSSMSRLARTINIGSRSITRRVKTAGMSMRRVAEGATGGETTEPTYARLEFVAFPAEVEPWVYNETLEDADIDLVADLSMESGISFAEGAAAEFITGDGVQKAQGITSYTNITNASYAWGKVGYIASGKSAAFASVAPSDKLIALQHALKAQYRPGAAWLMSDDTLSTVRQFKDASGAYYMWQPDTTAGFGGRLLGSPVEVDDNMPVVAANSYSVAFGNFSRGYQIVNRTGIQLIRDNLTAKGTTKFNFRRRFGGGIYNFEAIKLMKFATS